jgi:RHS repeat-associated protein
MRYLSFFLLLILPGLSQAQSLIVPGGETQVCLGTQYTYSSDYVATWTATGGTIIGPAYGNYVVVVWNNSNGILSANADVTYQECYEQETCDANFENCTYQTICNPVTTNETASLNISQFVVSILGGNVSVCPGTSVPLTSSHATQTSFFPGGPTYQWSRNGVSIAQATSPTYLATQNGTYNVSVTLPNCVVVSSSSTINWLPLPPKPTLAISSVVSFMGNSQLTATGGTSYSWFRNGNVIAGATSSTYQAMSTGSYTVSNTAGGCSQLSDPVLVEMASTALSTTTVRQAGVTSEAIVGTLNVLAGSASKTVDFSDYLGRPNLSLQSSASPTGKDIVLPHVYDNIGRKSLSPLPVATNQSNQQFVPNIMGAQNYPGSIHASYYNNAANDPSFTIPDDSNPFAKTIFENSPLNRVIQQGGIGTLWQPNEVNPNVAKTTKYVYGTNTANEVSKWSVVESGGLTATINRSYYPTQTLQVTTTTDEIGLQTVQYTDSQDRVVMIKKQEGSSWAETQYVYDIYGNLRFVLPPELSRVIGQQNLTQLGATPSNIQVLSQNQTLSNSSNSNKYSYTANVSVTLAPGFTSSAGFQVIPYNDNLSILNRLAFQYVYDNLNRRIAEKSPGDDWVFTVYDRYDRVVLTQNPLQRATNTWSFVKYDFWSRPVLVGYTTITTSVESIRQAAASHSVMYESRGTTVHGYSNNAYPNVSDENSYMAILFYDDYSFKSLTSNPALEYKNDEISGLPTSEYLNVRGASTGEKVKIYGTTTWIWTVSYYNDRGQTIQIVGNNHKGGIDRGSAVHNFSGQMTHSRLSHGWGSHSYSIFQEYQYDHTGRLLRKFHQMGTDPQQKVKVFELTYNDLGQVINKKLHSAAGSSSFLQSIDVRQNIQGWLTKTTSEDFQLSLGYESNQGLPCNCERPTGDITSAISTTNMKYTAPAVNQDQAWAFQFDNLNRFTNSQYWEKPSGTSSWGSALPKLTEEIPGYDLNGNIKTLKRKDYSGTLIDNLVYDYGPAGEEGNRLLSVTDQADTQVGFKDGNTNGQDYFYDAFGNIIKDLNRGVTLITYTQFNRTEQIQTGSGSLIKYIYNSIGSKLADELYSTSGTLLKRMDYIGSFVYENDVLQYIIHDEGRLLPVAGAGWEYQYVLRDHLGSARVLLSANPRFKEYKATMESDNSVTRQKEESEFLNLPGTRVVNTLANNTPGGNEVAVINGSSIVGPAISLQVMPGDAISASTYVYHEASGFGNSLISEGTIISTVAGAFGGISGAAGEAGRIFNGVQNAMGLYGPAINPSANHPSAYINYMVFDLNMVPITGGYVRVGTSPGTVQMAPILIDKPGYIFLFVSNEGNSSTPVYFDDFTVQHQESKLAGVYLNYPFGAEITSHTIERHRMPENLYRYQGKQLQQELGVDLYDFHARLYDPFLARWFSTDPKGGIMPYNSPYAAMMNNPILYSDPDGQCPICPFLIGAAIGAGVSAAVYTVSIALSPGGFDNWSWKDFGNSVALGAVSGFITAGIGQNFAISGEALKTLSAGQKLAMEIVRAGAHGITNSVLGGFFGQDVSLKGMAIGFSSSLASSMLMPLSNNVKFGSATLIGGSAVIGGTTSVLQGGNFWRGAAIGGIIAGANHLLHGNGDCPPGMRCTYDSKGNITNVIDPSEEEAPGSRAGLELGEELMVAIGEQTALSMVGGTFFKLLGNAGKILRVSRILSWGKNSNGHLIKHAAVLGFGEYTPQQLQKMLPQLRAAANQIFNNANPALTRVGQWHQHQNALMYISNGKMLVTQADGTFITVINKTSNNWYQLAKPLR